MESRTTVDVVHIVGDEILLVRRSERSRHPEYRGMWCLPGGGVQDGESWHDAAAREYFEETGLSVGPVDKLRYVDAFPASESPTNPETTNVFVLDDGRSNKDPSPRCVDICHAEWRPLNDVLVGNTSLAFNHADIVRQVYAEHID